MDNNSQNKDKLFVSMEWVDKLFEAQRRSIVHNGAYTQVEKVKTIFELEKLKDRIDFASQEFDNNGNKIPLK